MREYDIKLYMNMILNKNLGNPYHGKDGKFTYAPSGVGARIVDMDEYYSKDPKTETGFWDISHNCYAIVKKEGPLIMSYINDGKYLKENESQTKQNLDNMSEKQKEAIADYTSEYAEASYKSVNEYLRTGEGSDSVKEAANELSSALSQSKVGSDGTVWRGIDSDALGDKRLSAALKKAKIAIKRGNIKDATPIFAELGKLEGMTYTDKAPMSTNSYYKSDYGQRDIVLMIDCKKDTKGCNISSLSKYGKGEKDAWTEKFGSAITAENEVLLAPNTTLKFDKVELTDKNVIVTASIIDQK